MNRFPQLFHGLMSCQAWLTDDRHWSLTAPMTEQEWLSWHFPKDGLGPINPLVDAEDWEDDEDDEGEVEETGPPLSPRMRELAQRRMERA